jgi:hypothetical protein
MAVSYNVALRNSRLDAITTRAGNGAKLRIYSGTRPATGAAVTSQILLAELTCASPFAPAAADGVLTASPIGDDTAADATGIATWFRLMQSNGTTHVLDGDVGTSGADLNLNDTNIIEMGNVAVTSLVITAGNA